MTNEPGTSREEPPSREVPVLIAFAVLFAVVAANGFYSYRVAIAERRLESLISTQSQALAQTADRLNHDMADTKEKVSDLSGDMSFTKDRLGSTQVELRRAQQSSASLVRQQKEAATKWGDELSQIHEQQQATKGAMGTISTDVAGVKTGLNSTNDQLAATRSDLQRAIGDLGVQSGLIAHNASELDELKARGERNYIEFDIAKSKEARHVGTVAISLKKTDVKRQRFTLNLVSDDRTIEKKDKTVNEPVQFYQSGYRQPVELVVNQIYKDRIVGYLAVPKQKESRPALSQSGSQSGPENAKSSS